jgi:hypothetical protein
MRLVDGPVLMAEKLRYVIGYCFAVLLPVDGTLEVCSV